MHAGDTETAISDVSGDEIGNRRHWYDDAFDEKRSSLSRSAVGADLRISRATRESPHYTEYPKPIVIASAEYEPYCAD